jgi:predicted amidophosphoribosyltransferase
LRGRYAAGVPEDRDEWVAAMRAADVLHPPLAPPAACSRCLRPLDPDKRQWETCYLCGHEHPPTLPRITAATYGASGTRPWIFFTTAKFEDASAEDLARFVNGIAAMISLTIETEHPEFVDPDEGHIVVPVPSSSGLVSRCLGAIEANEWPSLVVVDALTAALDRPRQTDLNMDDRRAAAAGKYTASAAVEGKHVLLLDDAYTSGHTLHDAARAVAAGRALSVGGVVYARRIYPDGMAIYRAEQGEDDGNEG